MPLIITGQTPHNIWTPPFKNGIAAKVQDEVVTFEEMRKRIAPLIPEIQSQSANSVEFTRRIEQAYLTELQRRVEQILIISDFRERQYRIPENAIENEYQRVLREEFANDRIRFLKHLETVGLTPQQFRKELEEDIIVYLMRRQIVESQVGVSPEKIVAYYENHQGVFSQKSMVQLAVILFKSSPSNPGVTISQRIKEAIDELDSGIPFTIVAQKYSQDTSDINRRGQLTWRSRDDLRPELRQVAFAMQTGTYSQPIQIDDQVFILYVGDKNKGETPPLSQVRDEIERILMAEEIQTRQKRWLENLQRKAFIKYY